jgi:hypothetical protein
MSKPYFKINSVTYSNSNLTVRYDFGRTRGSVDGNNIIEIDGFSGSQTFTENNRYGFNEVQSITIGALGTSSTAGYTDPSSLTWTFGGTVSNQTNAKPTLGTHQLVSYTASAAQTLSDFLSGLATSVNTSSVNTKGIIASTTSTTITFAASNTGNLYNNTQLFMNLTRGGTSVIGTSSVGVTNSATYSGGVTTYNVEISIPAVGGYASRYSISSNTASVLL